VRSFGAEVTILEALPAWSPRGRGDLKQSSARSASGRSTSSRKPFEKVEHTETAYADDPPGRDVEAEVLLVAVGRGRRPRISAMRSRASRSTAAS